MLTSSANHYLRPEYLSPIQGNNIELDAKKSPLALLAQTCSQIGADAPQKSPSVPVTEKSKGKSTPGEKSPSGLSEEGKNTTSSSFKPYEKKKTDDEEGRASPLKRSPLGAKSPTSNSETARASSRGSEGGKSPLNVLDTSTSSSSHSTSSVPSVRASSSPQSTKASVVASSHTLTSLGDLSKDPLAAYKLTPGLYSPLSLGLDPLGAAGLSALTAKVPTSSANTSLSSPYVGYARVKTPSGSEAIVPVCRDPYCTGCQINTHALQVVNGTCPPGCSQCAQVAAHTKTLSSLPSSLISTIPPSSLASLYPPPGMVVGGGNPTHPYVCNWIAGDTYCGKRFPTSEDLLTHLRTHTNISTTSTSSTSESSSTASSLPLHHLLHHHPLLSAAHHTLPRGYPTPPLSPLSAAVAARYHPYAAAKSSPSAPLPAHLPPTSPLSSALSALAAPHPLSAYYNPYSLYARGLGASVGLHH